MSSPPVAKSAPAVAYASLPPLAPVASVVWVGDATSLDAAGAAVAAASRVAVDTEWGESGDDDAAGPPALIQAAVGERVREARGAGFNARDLANAAWGLLTLGLPEERAMVAIAARPGPLGHSLGLHRRFIQSLIRPGDPGGRGRRRPALVWPSAARRAKRQRRATRARPR